MLTRLQIKNFKRLEFADIELGKAVVLIGPNDSGKTTALQALALWDIGLKRWNEKRRGKLSPEKRPGVTINRKDLIAIPVPAANLLWRDLHVRNIEQVKEGRETRQKTQNIRIEVTVDGVTAGRSWSCGLEFDYANEESFYCRPLRVSDGDKPERMLVPDEAATVRVAFLPPMSGLAAEEPKQEPGRINVLIGEGQTAQVLRNLCYQIYSKEETRNEWEKLVLHIKGLFGAELQEPKYIAERGEITMTYRDLGGTRLDLSCSGRGLQQTLLLLAHLYANPNSLLLLDEPDAHLEILRQRQIYHVLTEVAAAQGSQIIAASHSEVILNEAAGRDLVIAFVGKPHRIDDRGSQVLKALKEIGFEQYYQAEQTGWVLYLEGSTDLDILRTFAKSLNHEAQRYLECPFVRYVGNDPNEVKKHFWGLKEAKPDLVGVALFDRLERGLPDNLGAEGLVWNKREIENYLCVVEALRAYARYQLPDDLFGAHEAERRLKVMEESVRELTEALKLFHKDPWSPNTKVTDDFLDPVFDRYFQKLDLPNLLHKSHYHVLAQLVPPEKIDPEVTEKLNIIVAVAKKSKPRKN